MGLTIKHSRPVYKKDMCPEGLKKMLTFLGNMLFAFFVLAVVFGVVWFFYLIVEIQKYQ